jgi:hypothetical protein
MQDQKWYQDIQQQDQLARYTLYVPQAVPQMQTLHSLSSGCHTKCLMKRWAGIGLSQKQKLGPAHKLSCSFAAQSNGPER